MILLASGNTKNTKNTLIIKWQLFNGINVKKLQFIHKLTASDTSKTAKITKGDITHQHIA